MKKKLYNGILLLITFVIYQCSQADKAIGSPFQKEIDRKKLDSQLAIFISLKAAVERIKS